MAIRYRNRQRRLERTISRIEAARRAIDGHAKVAVEHEVWWRRNGRAVDAWRRAIAERQQRQRSDRPAIAANRFKRWAVGLRLHPAVLLRRLECWWLSLKLRVRSVDRGPRL